MSVVACEAAANLQDSSIPFVLATGYDADGIPAEFEGVVRLQKARSTPRNWRSGIVRCGSGDVA
ncbi:hypothetical protein GCM10007887_10500 [Methylobacterium haplocladii]|uniref:Uncharacterized protein n=1 Tax=Methylobacterium haplocladii TaxID=1176176 RepID=A0A512IN08_9HYPH|nr:hypothetical protein MHA02_14810 [Methylobacterium haplocladii]GLS58390.1 hypothetical protein GCM10007887_10500 [Methylobacterium haplocladii]